MSSDGTSEPIPLFMLPSRYQIKDQLNPVKHYFLINGTIAYVLGTWTLFKALDVPPFTGLQQHCWIAVGTIARI